MIELQLGRGNQRHHIHRLSVDPTEISAAERVIAQELRHAWCQGAALQIGDLQSVAVQVAAAACATGCAGFRSRGHQAPRPAIHSS